MPRHVDVAERRSRLARRHRLLPGDATDDVAAIADSLIGLHSSDPVTVYLSAMARMRTPSTATVEQALYDDRTVVRHHAMRRTLWVATPDVVRLMHAAATRKLIGPEHRRTAKLLAENGIADPDAWLEKARVETLTALHEHGPLTARSLGIKAPTLMHKIVMAPGKKYSASVSAHTRVLLSLGFEGRIVRTRPTGTWINGAYTYAAADTWLENGFGELGERESARELALRWLHAFGPATAVDLQWWMGWTVALTKNALTDCGAVEVALDGGVGYVAPGDEDPVQPAEPWVALLPGLDPTTMGWKQRDWYLPEDCASTFDHMGNAGPTIWANGRVVGAWVQTPDGEIRTRLLVDVPRKQKGEIARRANDLKDLLDDTRFTVRFPSPASAALLV
ncbi:winged helix DNA-binding domain-containing protein [Antrihabitans cavernicola]|uniref:Winged helix DNA-binding domain-containing protein n=1 Tax=Antrihabitans cavernicola TaxID=2495913 RepID=A0A5A7SDW5_9NOCA|nr:winged helix DNA-binding domain-containing protein [Spelaeibacter cavernicola]KAA0022685.1 winged helix DNA-binding domain-containing protein [Spelaeibacter cavernicola]